jgi:RimJ/RimL family protein N-acetyltransferase
MSDEMELRTERLRLREFMAEDWRAVYAYQNDLRYLEFYAWEHRSEPAVKSFVQRFIDQQQETPRLKFQLAIVLPNDKVIGNIGIRKRELNVYHAELGYELDPREWHNGYAAEAAAAMLKFAFEKLRLHRVMARVNAHNHNSIRLLEKLGMRQEGRLREEEFFKGRYWDTLVYGLLEEEWRWRIVQSES